MIGQIRIATAGSAFAGAADEAFAARGEAPVRTFLTARARADDGDIVFVLDPASPPFPRALPPARSPFSRQPANADFFPSTPATFCRCRRRRRAISRPARWRRERRGIVGEFGIYYTENGIEIESVTPNAEFNRDRKSLNLIAILRTYIACGQFNDV